MPSKYIPFNQKSNRKNLMKFYRIILKLLLQLNSVSNRSQSKAVQIASHLIKEEFRKNFDIQDQETIDEAFDQAEQYIGILKTRLKTKQHMDKLEASEQKKEEADNDENFDVEKYLIESSSRMQTYWNYYFQQVREIVLK